MRAREELTWFRLASDSDVHGVRCGAEGAFYGPVRLLAHSEGGGGQETWAPRPIAEINAELSEAFGLPIDMVAKADGLTVIADSLNRREIAFAQIATGATPASRSASSHQGQQDRRGGCTTRDRTV